MKKILLVLALSVLFLSVIIYTGWKEPEKRIEPPMMHPAPKEKKVKKIVVYDFAAKWCPPCKAFAPIFEEWKKKYGNENISFIKVDTDEDKDLAAKFKISALPTVIILHDGVEVKKWVGIPKEAQVLEFLK